MRAELLGHGGNSGRGALGQRIAVQVVTDGGRQNVGNPHRAVVAQQQHIGVKSAWNTGRQQTGAGDKVEAEALVMGDGGAGRHRALAADHLGLVTARIVQDQRHVAARPAEIRLDDL
jgi:hypothetical protein